MINLDSFIDLIADYLFRVVNVEGNVDIVGVFMLFVFSLFFVQNWFRLFLWFWIHSAWKLVYSKDGIRLTKVQRKKEKSEVSTNLNEKSYNENADKINLIHF